MLHLLKGTPFVYQGEEIGMTNARFERIDQYRDLETLNHFEEQVAEGVSPEVFLAGANRNSRDHSRTPMQWSAADHGGFTTGTPWIEVNPNVREVNVEQDIGDPDSILAHYRRLIALRQEKDLVVFGHTKQIFADDPDIIAFERKHGSERLLVIANLTAQDQERGLPDDLVGPADCLICTHDPQSDIARWLSLRPYESLAWIIRGNNGC